LESEKGKQHSGPAALAEINKYHLMFAGYAPAEVMGFGDLGQLTKERMVDLIHSRVMEEARKTFDKAGVKTKPLHDPDEKEK
jgi:hypothetical protein